MIKVILSIIVLLVSLLPGAVHADKPDDEEMAILGPTWAQDKVCVQTYFETYWGIGRAVRQWNSIEATQPRYVRKAECPHNAVHIKQVYRKGWHGGLATVFTDKDGNIVRADIILNRASAEILTGERRLRWKRYAATHEVGHTLGLPHSEVKGSVMCYCTNYYKNNGKVHWSDHTTLQLYYPPIIG